MVLKKKALFFFPSLSSFIKKDLEILELQFNIHTNSFQPKKKWHSFSLLLKQFFFLLKNIRASIYIIEFAGYHSFLPVFFGRICKIPTLIICGGNDCHSFPAIKYGNHSKLFLSAATRYSLIHCTQISTKHDSLWFCNYNYDQRFPNKQGIKAFIPNIKTPNATITNGYDSTFWKNTLGEKKPYTFITVCGNLHLDFQIELKGIDLFIEAAKIFPLLKFTIVGASKHHRLKKLPSNIEILGNKNSKELRELFSENKYYIQLSLAEGFPNALCEAMLCECIPVVSDVFSMKEIIENTGYVLAKKDIGKLKSIFTRIQAEETHSRHNARNRIQKNYDIEFRRNKLTELVNKLTKQ